MKQAWWTAATLAAAMVLLHGIAQAQTQRSSGGEAQKFMQQYQQLAAEKTALQSQVEGAKKDLDQARAELASVKKERDQLKAQSGGQAASVAQIETARAAAEKTSEQYKERLNDIVARYRELAQSLKTVEGERNAAQQQLAERNTQYDKCAEDNTQLYGISSDVLNRFEHGGNLPSSPLEPFTRLTRTRIENLVDEYRVKAQELRVKQDAR